MDRYQKPLRLNTMQVVGSKTRFALERIVSVLRQTDNARLIVAGAESCGKSHVLQTVLQDSGFHVHQVDIGSIANVSGVKHALESFLRHRTIDTLFFKKKKVLIVDDIDVWHSMDKQIHAFLAGCFKNKQLGASIILTHHPKNGRVMADLKRCTDKGSIVSLVQPSVQELVEWVVSNEHTRMCSCSCSACLQRDECAVHCLSCEVASKSNVDVAKEYVLAYKHKLSLLYANITCVWKHIHNQPTQEDADAMVLRKDAFDIAHMMSRGDICGDGAVDAMMRTGDMNTVVWTLYDNMPRKQVPFQEELANMKHACDVLAAADKLDAFSRSTLGWGGVAHTAAAYYKAHHMNRLMHDRPMIPPLQTTSMVTRHAKLVNHLRKAREIMCEHEIHSDARLYNLLVQQCVVGALQGDLDTSEVCDALGAGSSTIAKKHVEHAIRQGILPPTAEKAWRTRFAKKL